ncbi:tyrosine-type recombinase/integrase [Dactylosporangium sp. AC04546]|uniref:tyrosine-type recombinase/integrase n=1 Tax=Dactylosporangium sp. AC04546 TaxID=2862460 RepID=UPI001EE06E6C|nr:site-specific integrase [Dactylosporangium sp. AC04546]WVK80381.1 tyrosine-type recombinase/integrase [Dactylosporangium sp. AC04546]
MTSTAIPANRADVEAARLLLNRMGISIADLQCEQPTPKPVPTFEQYVEVVSAAVSDSSRRAYGSYWKRALTKWAGRPLDDIKASEIESLVEEVKATRVLRSNGRGGHGSAENMIAALRCLYRRAVADGYVTEAQNPALKVAKPKRLQSTRRALADARLAEVNAIAGTTGDDPALDALLIRLHTETACRRGGALALTVDDLDEEQCLILLREKGGTSRWQPVSPTLMRHLRQHADERCPEGSVQLLRYRDGRPVTRRRYDHIWVRLARHLPWVAKQKVSTHWLRHTTLTWVERNFGFAVAREFAGHAEGGNDAGSTTTYVRATIHELAAAVAAMTGEPHPLAT